jgi:AraC-like DNA-binding protein/mannose-6-phosphate isomerase-like protein (cupin superfamily)
VREKMEPYLEEKVIVPGQIAYPFSCFITTNNSVRPIVPPHFHNYIEILYVVYGEMGIQFGNQSYNASSGTLVLIDSREVHSTYIDKNLPTKCIVLKFEPEVFSLSGTALEMRYIVSFTNPEHCHQKVFGKEELEGTFIRELIEETLSEFQNQNYGFELSVIAGIYKIFLWILRNGYSNKMKREMDRLNKSINIEVLQIALKHIQQHFKEDISIDTLAEMCNMSYSYFSRQFAKVIGKTFKEYLNFIRINEAEKLLITSNMNITEVALETGFSNTSYFIKQFKLYKGISPKQYRKNLLITAEGGTGLHEKACL